MTCRALSFAVLASLAILGGFASVAHAEPPGSSIKDAGIHFQRGVALYTEADYRAALVEFRRAYDIAPNAAVLYNIGETYYQLQNYAAALLALQRYLVESGTTASHRQEVEQTLDTLRARVGKIAITTNAVGCEITIDDELVGKTPLGDPVLVSIGRRKITARLGGRPAETRFVDVAAGDTVRIALSVGDPSGLAPPGETTPIPAGPPGRRNLLPGWIATGILGAGAVTTGVLAILASRDLQDARNQYPVLRDDLDRKASRVKVLSIVGDALGIATVIVGGITLELALSQSSSHEVHLAIAPNGIQLAGTFR